LHRGDGRRDLGDRASQQAAWAQPSGCEILDGFQNAGVRHVAGECGVNFFPVVKR
jgi:hypothetical protein